MKQIYFLIIISFIVLNSCKKIDSVIENLSNNKPQDKKVEYLLIGEKYIWNTNNTSYCCTSSEEITYNYSKDYNLESKYSFVISKESPFQRFDTTYYYLKGQEYFQKYGSFGSPFLLGKINSNGYLSGSDKNNEINYKITSQNISGEIFYDSTFSGGISETFDIYGNLISNKFALGINSYLSKKSYPLERKIEQDIFESTNRFNDLGCIYSSLTEYVKQSILSKDNSNSEWKFKSHLPITQDNRSYNTPMYFKDEYTYIKSIYDEPKPNVSIFKVKTNKLDSVIIYRRVHSTDNTNNFFKIIERTDKYIDNLDVELDGRINSFDLFDEKGVKICTRQFVYKEKS